MTKLSFAELRYKNLRPMGHRQMADNRISYSVHKTKDPYAHFYIGEFYMQASGLQIGDKVDIIMDTDDGFTTIKRLPGDTKEPHLTIGKAVKGSGRGRVSIRWLNGMPKPDELIVMEAVVCEPNRIIFNFPEL